MKKKTLNRIFWAVVAIVLCTLVCVQWFCAGCGWQSLVMAAAFYCALCFGGYVFVDDILRERRRCSSKQTQKGGVVPPNKHRDDFITRSETVVDINKLKEEFEKGQQKQ